MSNVNTNRCFQVVVSNQINVVRLHIRGAEEAGKPEG